MDCRLVVCVHDYSIVVKCTGYLLIRQILCDAIVVKISRLFLMWGFLSWPTRYTFSDTHRNCSTVWGYSKEHSWNAKIVHEMQKTFTVKSTQNATVPEEWPLLLASKVCFFVFTYINKGRSTFSCTVHVLQLFVTSWMIEFLCAKREPFKVNVSISKHRWLLLSVSVDDFDKRGNSCQSDKERGERRIRRAIERDHVWKNNDLRLRHGSLLLYSMTLLLVMMWSDSSRSFWDGTLRWHDSESSLSLSLSLSPLSIP